ncbi:MFS transporter [Stenotrophomonas pigmentata]|uniref:MFS transporter n=1 Tax=Stenotrophomonas pigmentata TaxID=3055080 RepID=UPI0026F25091|nr:MFS transporter [Stenotrophomonas sp. 610A2]
MQTHSSTATAVAHPWLAVVAVALATFSVVTTEMLPVGLLTPIAQDLAISAGNAGLLISAPALLAALFAPMVVIAAGGINRRRILCGLLMLLVVANAASALAPNMAWMLAARLLVGVCMGGIWAIAGGLAIRLVVAQRVGLATAIIFGGVAAASVLGVPLGAWIGELFGWRQAFAGMALLSTLVLLLHVAVIPSLPVIASIQLRHFAGQLRNRQVLLGLGLTLLLVTGHFAAFTYVRPLLELVSGVDTAWIGGLLLAYGIAGIVGNFLVGLIAPRNVSAAVITIAAGLLATSILLLSVGDAPLHGGLLLLLWGLAYGGVSVGLMTWMMQAAAKPGSESGFVPKPDSDPGLAIEVNSALYVGAFNVGIALGAWAGGRLLDQAGLGGNLSATAVLAATALLLCIASMVCGRRC